MPDATPRDDRPDAPAPPDRPTSGEPPRADAARAADETRPGDAARPGDVARPGDETRSARGGGGTDRGADGSEREDDLDLGAETPVGDRAGFRLAAFGAVLIVVLFAGYGLGRLNDSTASASAPPTTGAQAGAQAGAQVGSQTGAQTGSQTGAGMPGMAGAPTGSSMPGMAMDENQPHSHNADGTAVQGGAAMPMGSAVGGLSLSSGGLTLVPETTAFSAGKAQRLSFRVTGAGGAPITTYAVVHDKPLHLIVVRRDLTGFQHLHPTMAADGTWGIDLTLAEPGIYRMIADFTAIVGGQQIATTLGGDLTVAGNYAPRVLPEPARADRPDGLTVAYEGTPDTKATQPLLMTVTGADGRTARLDPYLGAFGHLVVMRQGDLAYVHVHPETTLVDGKVKFWLTAPSSGTYRMFFDFQVAGRVHTAAWTVVID